jgi:ESS family glutamate:Na+ symporter
MPPPFSFDPLLVFGYLSIMLLFGLLLRAYIPVFQKIMFPASLTGGLIGLLLISFELVSIDVEIVKTFAYHFFNISFISVGLTSFKEELKIKGGEQKIIKGSAWMAIMQAVTFPLQAIIGTLILFFFVTTGSEPLFKTFGFLLPLAFNEGPGQALSIGRVWEGMGFANASTIGLTFATLGYFFAFFVGVPLANRGMKKGKYQSQKLPAFFVRGILQKGEEPKSAGSITTHGSNIDCITFHMALVGMAYIITYFIVLLLSNLLPSDAGSIAWGFFFLFGLIVAILLRILIERTTQFGHLLDPALQRRITGFSVDYLVVATGCGIQFFIIWKYFIPIIAISVIGGIITTLTVFMLGKRLQKYKLERVVAIYGVVTGTVSCGLMLLRIVDPEFKTPVAREIGFMNIFAIPIIGGLTALLNAPFWWGWSMFVTCLVLFFILIISLIVLLSRTLWKEDR